MLIILFFFVIALIRKGNFSLRLIPNLANLLSVLCIQAGTKSLADHQLRRATLSLSLRNKERSYKNENCTLLGRRTVWNSMGPHAASIRLCYDLQQRLPSLFFRKNLRNHLLHGLGPTFTVITGNNNGSSSILLNNGIRSFCALNAALLLATGTYNNCYLYCRSFEKSVL